MTTASQLAMLRQMTNSSWTDDKLSTYLTIAGQKILLKAYPYDSSVATVPAEYQLLQVEIAAYLVDKDGAYGETVHNENGIYRSYENADVPASMLRSITPHVGVIQ